MSLSKRIKPLGNRILVKRKEVSSNQGGIFLPDSAQEKPKEGEVVGAGEGKINDKGTLIPMDIKIGDRVIFGAYAGTEAESDDEAEYLLMSEEDVLAVIE
jgi:chaperonin GroES